MATSISPPGTPPFLNAAAGAGEIPCPESPCRGPGDAPRMGSTSHLGPGGVFNMPGTERVEITGPYGDRYDEILTPQAIGLIAALHAELGPRRSEVLAARRRRQAELSGGAMLDFLPETAHIREDPDWRVAPPPPGPVARRGGGHP